MTSHVAVQKMIALSLIGYLEAMRRHQYIEHDINYVFKPMQTCERMSELRLDTRIMDAMYQLDEVEALSKFDDDAAFCKAVDNLILPLLAFLREIRAPNDGSEAALARLIERCGQV